MSERIADDIGAYAARLRLGQEAQAKRYYEKIMSAIDALQERVARATEAVAYPAPPPEVRNHDDYYAGCAAYRNALRASLSAKEGP